MALVGMIDFQAFFTFSDTSAFPAIAHNQAIPEAHYSALGGRLRLRKASAAIIRAACVILTGQVELCQTGPLVQLRFHSSGGGTRISATRVEEGRRSRHWMNHEGRTAPVLLLIADVMLHDSGDEELRQRWLTLVQEAQRACGALPIQPERLAERSHLDERLRLAMLAFSDSAYYTLKALNTSGHLTVSPSVPQAASWESAHRLFGQTRPVAPAGPEARLARLVRRGGTALLIGPTGCGKTELVKRVALAAGARLVSTEGRPGLEDRDLIGQIAPTRSGPAWVDGPLAQAFRLALAGERVVLKIDELLRFEPYHLNVLIGMLDTVNEAEIHAMGLKPISAGRHYTLKLPGTGEVLLAPVSHLSVVATTNAGSAYLQGGALDPALQRRFSLTAFFTYPSEAEILPVLVQACGSEPLARAAYTLEVSLRAQTTAQGGLLSQPSNTGVTLAHLHETLAGVLDGEDPSAAFLGAALVTVAPNVVPLTEDGVLDPVALETVFRLAQQASVSVRSLCAQDSQRAG